MHIDWGQHYQQQWEEQQQQQQQQPPTLTTSEAMMSRMLFRSLPSTSLVRRTICIALQIVQANGWFGAMASVPPAAAPAYCRVMARGQPGLQRAPAHPHTHTCGWQHDWRRPVKAARARPTALPVVRARCDCGSREQT